MADSDPTDTGGLFVGRRPTARSVRYRREPIPGGPLRHRADRALAGGLLLLETVVLGTLWGPQPAVWIWIGSQLNHQTGSVVLGLFVTFTGMILTMVGTIAVAIRLDHAWKLTRRAAGFQQREGAINRIFVVSGALGFLAFELWFYWIERAFIIPFMPNQ